MQSIVDSIEGSGVASSMQPSQKSGNSFVPQSESKFTRQSVVRMHVSGLQVAGQSVSVAPLSVVVLPISKS